MHVILRNMRITKCRLSGKAGGEIYFFFFRIARTFLRSKSVVLVSNDVHIARIPKGMGYMRCCVSGAVLYHLLSVYHQPFFFYFLIGGKINLKKYLQKFVDVSYLRIFVENNKK